MRPAPTQITLLSPHSCSPSTLMRRSTRSLMACASSEDSLCVVNDAHSGFCPAPSTFRYEIKYFGMEESASFHQVREAVEQIVRVVRARRRLGVVLHAEHGQFGVTQALARSVVQVQVARLPTAPGERRRIDGEAVVLRRDLHAPGREILHGMVGAVMAEGQLVGLAAGREPQDLMAEADTEDRHAADQGAHAVHQIGYALRIAGAVRQERAVRPVLQHGLGRRAGGHDRHLAAGRTQLTQDVELDTGVERDDVEAGGRRRPVTLREVPRARLPGERFRGRHLGHEVAADEPRQRAHFFAQPGDVEIDRGDDAVLRARIAQMSCQRPRVDGLQPHEVVRLQIVVEADAAAPRRRAGRGFLDDEAVGPRAVRLDVLFVDAVVADHRVRHGHDLAAIRRIREDLLVSRHGRIEDDFTAGFPGGAEGAAAEDAPVAQHEQGRRVGHASHTTFPPTIVLQGRPVAVQPANGVLRLLDLKRAGSIVTAPSGSISVRSAGAPAPRLPPGSRSSRAGSRESRDTSVAPASSPRLTSRSSSSVTAVSSPTTPLAAWSNSPSFSLTACGAWSVATQSIVPSASASISASVSRLLRRGGAIFMFASHERTASSVSSRWWGVTSAVTRTPRAFASRTSRTAPAVERCAMWTWAPVSSASTMSRATITSSAAAGMPGSPSSVDTTPSCMQPARDSVWSSAWLITGAPKGRVYSMARR